MSIPLFKVFMNPSININPVLTSGFITQGLQVEKFEKDLCEFFNHPYILTLNSATSGLTLAIRMLNLEPKSEILSTPLTCTATNFAILANNHKIKWIDIDRETCNIDLRDLENKITENTKAIVLVHWGGYPVDLDEVKRIVVCAEKRYGNKITVIEDCAHAFGSVYKDKFIGTHGNVCVFSTQAIKHLTTGDGGLIFLPNKEMYERAKLLRWYGISREQRSKGDFRLEEDVKEWGYKFHMNDINASIGISNLPFMKENLEKIRNNASYLRENLSDIDGVTLMKENNYSVSSYWIFTIKILNKQGFIEFMKKNGVVVSQVHNRNDIHSCLAESKCSLANLDKLETEMISIPCGWWITKENMDYMIQLIKEWCEVKIREIRNTDVSYLDLLFQMNGYRIVKDKFFEKLEKVLAQGSKIFVIEHNEKIIASGKILIEDKFGDPQAHIEDVVVDRAYRNQKLGTRIVEHMIDYAKNNCCYKISLCAKSSLDPFYNKYMQNVGNHYVKYNLK